jgi:drug/metabolite transporter (DMT)-like permease
VASLAILGVLGTGIAYVQDYQIITSEGATIASTVTYLLPVVAIVLGVVVLGENVTVMALAGIALVLAGVALTRRHARLPMFPRGSGKHVLGLPRAIIWWD